MQEVEHPEENIQEFIVNVLAQLINFIHLLIPVVVKFSREYPTVFVTLSTLALLYILYRVLMNLYTMAKRLMYLAVILVLIGCYMRGEAFFDDDLPKIGNYLWTHRETIAKTASTTVRFLLLTLQRQVTLTYVHLRNHLETMLQ